MPCGLSFSRARGGGRMNHNNGWFVLSTQVPAGATKGGMILRLASLLGVARKDIYCIGDHKNDIPMLEVSAVPFAPANAIPAVHEFGAHIVSHCSDGAVADVVEYLDKIY